MARWTIDLLASAPADDTTSGLSRVVWELGAATASLGHRVRVLYPADPPTPAPPFRGVEAVPIPVADASRRPFGRDRRFGERATALIGPSTDLVVGNDEKAGALGRLKGPPGRPVFAMFVHDVALHTFDTLRPLEPDRGIRQRVGNFLDRRALQRLESAALRRAKIIFVGSGLNAQLLERHYGVAGPRVHMLPLGVPGPRDVGTRLEARQALHIPPDVPVVAFVGRTPERQGLPTALAAFARVRAFFPGARFVVVGSSPAAAPGVLSLGTVDEDTKARVLRAADVFLFPTRYEGFGLAPREAMAYGLPTVVSRHVPLDGIADAEAVRVVGSDDPGEYASELAELLADPALRRTMGEAARSAARSFSFERMADRFEQAVAPLLGG